MDKKKKNLLVIPSTLLVLSAICYGGYEYSKKDNNSSNSLVQNVKEVKKIAYAEKESTIVVTAITEDGYATLHGDHSHFEKGLVPYNAKFIDSLVYKNDNYTLKDEDIQYEVAQGYIIKIDGKFYYYPKKGVTQSNIVDEKTAKEITAHAHHHAHSSSSNSNSSSSHEDNYTFNPSDIVSETADGYVVRHGDHYHYIKKSSLSSSQLSQAKQSGVNYSLSHSTAGISSPTSDGYIFRGAQDIIGSNSFGFIVQHGSHQHIIPYSQLRGTKWEYLLNNHSTSHATTQTSPNNNDNYKFDPKDIVSEDKYGYTVRHNDHYHYIPKPNNGSITTPLPSIPKPAVPAVDNNSDKNNNSIKPSILSFAGIQFKTSDGFILSDDSKTTPTSTGLLASHDGHEHFIFYKQLVNSKWKKLIPEKYLDKAKEEYNSLEKEVNEKINYLSEKNKIDKTKFKYVATSNGDALTYDGTTTLLKDININKNDKVENKPEYSAEVTKKINHLAKILNIDSSLIKLVETENGQALTYPHGDHSHTVLLNAIHVDETEVELTDEIKKQIDYIADVYGVPKEAIKVTKDFFVFNEPSHAYDPTHIHPYIIPRNKLEIPKITGDDELDFENELLSLSKRTGIPVDKITVEGDKFVIPHGDHDHYVKIISKGANLYYKNKLPNITGTYVAGEFDKTKVLNKIEKLKADSSLLYSSNTKKAHRINRALNQLISEINTLPSNSTAGYLEMLNNFDNKYINIKDESNTSPSTDAVTEQLTKTYNELLNKVKESNVEYYSISKTDLTNKLNKAISEKDSNAFEQVSHLLDEIKKFDNQTGATGLSYIKYFIDNLESNKVNNNLREEMASLIKDTYESEAKISIIPMHTLVERLINTKNLLHYLLEHPTTNRVEHGTNYNKLQEIDESGETIAKSAKQFVSELSDFLPALEFSKANYVIKNEKPSFESNNKEAKSEDNKNNSADNNTSTNHDDANIQTKVNYLAQALGISPSSISVIDTPNGKALVFTLNGKTHVILASSIDLSKPLPNLRAENKETQDKAVENKVTENKPINNKVAENKVVENKIVENKAPTNNTVEKPVASSTTTKPEVNSSPSTNTNTTNDK